MIADIDIWRAAALLVKQHGEDAMFLASQRADGMLAKGDVDGLSVWKRISAAVRELSRARPKDDEPRH